MLLLPAAVRHRDLARYFSFYFPIEIMRFAALLHAFGAFVHHLSGSSCTSMPALWIKGSIGAMTRGTVTYGWARKHHPNWFEEIIGK
jgi:formate dehydrogenase subunit gamma